MTKEITISDVREQFDKLLIASITPDPRRFTKYKKGYIIDENQSVEWNREQVAAANKAYAAEVIRLLDARNRNTSDAYDIVIRYLDQELHLGRDKCQIIWNRLYEDNHSYIEGLCNCIDDEIDYIKSILE